MSKNSLSSKGLSLSQATSISNLCNQRASEIGKKLEVVNNYSKTVTVGNMMHVTVKGRPLPENVVDLLKEKAELHACQAFLMENIKTKDAMLKQIKVVPADISGVKFPEEYEYVEPKVITQVGEDWGWDQLTVAEYNEFLEAQAYAAHIGEFIHKGSPLDKLRAELSTLPDIEWMNIKDGEKSPVVIETHHTSEGLLKVHEDLAAIHRSYEQRVNYFNAKVKNLVTAENARIAKLNSDAQNEATKINNDRQTEYQTAYKKATEELLNVRAEFENARQASIKEIAALKISVDPRFQKVIDIFLVKLPETPQE
jgi:hypothetical protein